MPWDEQTIQTLVRGCLEGSYDREIGGHEHGAWWSIGNHKVFCASVREFKHDRQKLIEFFETENAIASVKE